MSMNQPLADSEQLAHMRKAFAQDSINALHDMKASGIAYELGDVRMYFSQLADHRNGKRDRPAPLQPLICKC